MNGNITKEGIRLDLEWMHRVGIGGFQNFDASLFPDKVVEKRLVYMTPEWKEAFLYATTLADQLGLEEAIAGSPGWSESGGPWVTPAQAMKKLVWSETRVEGGRRFTGALPKPPTTTGPFQNAPLMSLLAMLAGQAPKPAPELYNDSAVIAYRVPAGDVPMTDLHPVVTSSSGTIDPSLLADGDFVKFAALPMAPVGQKAWIQFDFAKASGDSRRVPRDRGVQVAVRPAAARTRPRGERRRPELQEGRQHSRAARPRRTRCRSRRFRPASSGWRS